MFLKEALKMTDNVNKFNAAGAKMGQQVKMAGWRRGQNLVAVNLKAELQRRGVVYGNDDKAKGL